MAPRPERWRRWSGSSHVLRSLTVWIRTRQDVTRALVVAPFGSIARIRVVDHHGWGVFEVLPARGRERVDLHRLGQYRITELRFRRALVDQIFGQQLAQ